MFFILYTNETVDLNREKNKTNDKLKKYSNRRYLMNYLLIYNSLHFSVLVIINF